MPRDGAGVYSLPNGSTATPNTPVLASQHNTPLADLAVEMTASVPRSGAAPMLGSLTLAADPTAALHAATKQYVDNVAAGLDIKASVLCATTANITLSGEQTLDGVLTSNSRVLVKNQTAPAQNGILISAAGAWTRATDMDAWTEVPGASVWVEQGTTQGDTGWVCTANQGGTIGTTAITWQQFGGSGAFQAASVLLSSIAALAIVAGDLVFGSGANAVSRLAKGELGQSLMQAASAPAWGLPQGYLFGLGISRASATTFGIATGIAAGDNQGAITLGSAFTKSLSAWAVGSGNGGLDTGAVAASTWYHVHLIRKDSDGSADVLCSLSVAAPTMPGGYTARRRIGSFKTDGSSQIIDFVQFGNNFLWVTPSIDFDVANPGTAAVLRALNVPTGLKVVALITAGLYCGTTVNDAMAFTSPDAADQTIQATATASLTGFTSLSSPGGSPLWTWVEMQVRTNASGQIRTKLLASGAADHIAAIGRGWTDQRGR